MSDSFEPQVIVTSQKIFDYVKGGPITLAGLLGMPSDPDHDKRFDAFLSRLSTQPLFPARPDPRGRPLRRTRPSSYKGTIEGAKPFVPMPWDVPPFIDDHLGWFYSLHDPRIHVGLACVALFGFPETP